MNIKKKTQEAVGDAVVQGTKESIRKDLEENWREYAKYACYAIGAVAGVNILFNIINRPRAARCNVHFYIHIQ